MSPLCGTHMQSEQLQRVCVTVALSKAACFGTLEGLVELVWGKVLLCSYSVTPRCSSISPDLDVLFLSRILLIFLVQAEHVCCSWATQSKWGICMFKSYFSAVIYYHSWLTLYLFLSI